MTSVDANKIFFVIDRLMVEDIPSTFPIHTPVRFQLPVLSALLLYVGQQESHLTCKNPAEIFNISKKLCFMFYLELSN